MAINEKKQIIVHMTKHRKQRTKQHEPQQNCGWYQVPQGIWTWDKKMALLYSRTEVNEEDNTQAYFDDKSLYIECLFITNTNPFL